MIKLLPLLKEIKIGVSIESVDKISQDIDNYINKNNITVDTSFWIKYATILKKYGWFKSTDEFINWLKTLNLTQLSNLYYELLDLFDNKEKFNG